MVVFVLLVSLFLFVAFDPGQQVLEVGRGELPFERSGGGVVALLEGGELSQEACTGVWIMTVLGGGL